MDRSCIRASVLTTLGVSNDTCYWRYFHVVAAMRLVAHLIVPSSGEGHSRSRIPRVNAFNV